MSLMTKSRSSLSMPLIVSVPSQTISIHRLDAVPNASNTGEAYVVAGDNVWLDGIFDSQAAALAAASLLAVDELVDLWSETRGETVASTPEEDPILDIDDVAGVLNARAESAKLHMVPAPATVGVAESHLTGGKVMDISCNSEIVTIHTPKGSVELAPGESYTYSEPDLPDLPIVNNNR